MVNVDPTGVDVISPAVDKQAALVQAETVNDHLRAALPGILVSDEKTARLFEHERAIRHDEATGSWAWVAVNRELKYSSVVWLLPLDLPAGDHLRSLAAALQAAGDAYPAALDWEVRATFETPGEPLAAQLKALTWQQYFPAAKVDTNKDGTVANISLPTLREAIAATQTWKL